MESRKMVQKDLFAKQKQRTNLWIPKGEKGGFGMNWETGPDIHTYYYV